MAPLRLFPGLALLTNQVLEPIVRQQVRGAPPLNALLRLQVEIATLSDRGRIPEWVYAYFW